MDRRTLADARREDLKYASQQDLGYVSLWTANVMVKIGKRLNLRQQVVATANVYLRRFYLKNSFCEVDVCPVMGACIYVATKVEELPIHIKTIVGETRSVLGDYGLTYPSDQAKTAEMEFYLLEDLECHLVVFHPYRSLLQLTGRDGREAARAAEALDLDETTLQNAWYIINDTYRADFSLLYPPHIIAIASIYLALSLAAPTPEPSRSQSHTLPAKPSKTPKVGGKVDHITFLATLDVSMPLVVEVIQELISLYALWREFEAVGAADADVDAKAKSTILPGEKAVVATLTRMRQAKEVDIAHPPSR